MKLRFIAVCILLLATAAACNNDALKIEEEALSKDGISLWFKGEQVFVYDRNTCQYSYSPENCEFRAFDDEMSNWMSIKLKSLPSSEGDKAEATIEWTTSTDIKQKKSIKVKNIKVDGNKLWLWSLSSNTGAIIVIP